MENEHKLQRVNTKLPQHLNDWLDDESSKTGISKSSLIMLSVQAYHDQKIVIKKMADLGEVTNELERLRETIERNGLE